MPKTIKNQFDKYLTYENLMRAHIESRKNKSYKEEIILFNLKQEEYIKWLLEELRKGTYKHGGYKVFYVHIPKERKIEASRYIDRVVHRWVADSFLKPYFETQFIETSYACIKNRGMHKATLDVQKAMRHYKNIWNEYYIIKMDVRKYFQNIDKDILINILKRKVKDKKLMRLIEEIVYSNKGKKGIPIGNYTSQIFANIYLNEIDQYIKHKLKCKYYFRYMDDSIILLKTKDEAKRILEEVKKFLKEKLDLELNNKTQILKSKQGINFCGYKINEYRLKIRDRGKKSLKKKIKKMERQVLLGEISTKDAYKKICGHIGYIKIANVKNLTNKLFFTGN
ncbi:MAG: group II intron reverse transcriptase domain-containing protein [Clostridia bacterium]|nr:group II intron reverse transcriptase domain-containing protein [Clostridia bacterium]